MFKLHIYNPEHDIALGKNEANFTPPKAARMTKERFYYVPAYWAEEGDWVLRPTQEPTQASIVFSHPSDSYGIGESNPREGKFGTFPKVRFVTWEDLRKLTKDKMPAKIEPWGWDKLIVSQLVKCNPLFKALVPNDEKLDEIRRLSSREFAAEKLLPLLVTQSDEFVGEAKAFKGSVDELEKIAKNNGSIVLKSPWSCSGRGVRFIEGELTESETGWVKNILAEQGIIMIEPKYNKVLDFAMEFMSNDEEGTQYMGLNIFDTKNGAYLQNAHGKEEDKETEISHYIDTKLLRIIKEAIVDITSREFKGRYSGPFGVDMMIVKDAENKTKIHPCVEMNLRRTMGQVGL